MRMHAMRLMFYIRDEVETLAVTLKTLFKNAQIKYDMQMIAGGEAVNRAVNWVHMLEDPQTAMFLHGGELIFTTGIGHNDTKWLRGFAESLFCRGACGIVINIGPYIKEIPGDVAAFCAENNFPLFTIPWSTRIVDITHYFCSYIIKSEEKAISAASAFKTAIFCPGEDNLYKPPLELGGFDLSGDFIIAAVSPRGCAAGFDTFENKAARLLSLRLTPITPRFTMFTQDEAVIIVLQGVETERLREMLSTISIENEDIRVALGGAGSGIDSLPRTYKRARAALSYAEKRGARFVSYDDLGIFKIFLEVENKEELRGIYEQRLKKLEEYDRQNNSDLTQFLRLYLEHSAGVQEVAGLLNVHRNTVNYKLKKIREILNCDLSYADCMELMLAFYIKEIL